VIRNHTKALKWFHLAASQGLPQAQYVLAALYHDGVSLPQNSMEAIKWLRKAAAQGHLQAQERLQALVRQD
ncbi:TPA: sel1 repeat family protein, partial [Legionella pneumophila]|nr:sel1 repeat family protein [Legionella pneumophila]